MGRTRTPDALKQAYLGALRYGLNKQTARSVCGIAEIVVRRWREEEPADGVMSFSDQEAQASASLILDSAQTLAILARPKRDAKGVAEAPGNLKAAQYVLNRLSEEFGTKGAPVPGEVARQIREFVGQAMRSQHGVDKPGVIESFDDTEEDMKDEQGAT